MQISCQSAALVVGRKSSWKDKIIIPKLNGEVAPLIVLILCVIVQCPVCLAGRSAESVKKMKKFDSRFSLACLLLTIGSRTIAANVSEKPNIVIILADDMGFNDVSFHGSNQILTPNIDALGYNGIILNRHYVPNLCTPSRATLLTGKYPIRTGTQHFVIINDEPWGLPLKETLMPEIFRDAGYATNLVGKWHLGFWKKEYTPTMRGFDHHFGYYSGYIDYYNQTMFMLNRNYSRGLDLRRDLVPTYEGRNVYATKLFTDEGNRIIREHDAARPLFLMMSHLAVHTGNEDNPMQAPEDVVSQFDYIRDPKRRRYAAMVSSLDESVGETIGALSAKGILNNTIILFYSDNGAPTLGIHSNSGSNYPFRGQKDTPWEGGIRSAGVLWSPLLKQKKFVSNQIVHAIDWLPTLASAADVPLPQHLHFDGTDMWDALSNNREPQSRRLLHALDDVLGYSSYLRGNLKYVNGTTIDGEYDGWLGELFEVASSPPSSQMAYHSHVLNSKVHRLIKHDDQLTADKIESLRAAATVHCSHRFDDVRVEIDKCEPLINPCFFNIDEDPCEMFNLAKKFPLEVALLEKDLDYFRMIAVKPARRSYSDPLSDPKMHNFTWSWWGDDSVEFTDLPEASNHSARKYSVILLLLVSFCFWFSLF